MPLQTKSEFINRELSWLEFNDRVLQCATNESVPLLERLKFLAITGSNLDEFFMVRVGGLQMLVAKGLTKKDPSGMRPAEQLGAVLSRSERMVNDQYACYASLEREIAAAGIVRLKPHELTDEQSRHAEYVFDSDVLPVLSPMALSSFPQAPLLANRLLYVAVRLTAPIDPLTPASQPAAARTRSSVKRTARIAIVPVARNQSRFVTMPADGGYCFMLIEDIFAMFASRFFPRRNDRRMRRFQAHAQCRHVCSGRRRARPVVRNGSGHLTRANAVRACAWK